MTVYSIQDLSRRYRMRTSALRYYEELGLLGDIERNASGQRVYRQADVERLESILCFKDAGMTISEIRSFFTYEADEREHIADMLKLLTDRKQAIEAQRDALEEAYLHVCRKVGYYSAVQRSIEGGQRHPGWSDFAD